MLLRLLRLHLLRLRNLHLLRLRYLQGLPEEKVIARLYVGRTTYYTKELEALSTVAVCAADAGLLPGGQMSGVF